MVPWNESVVSAGKLTVYSGTLSGVWSHVLREAVRDLNVLFSANKVGISFVESRSAPAENGGALVSAETADGRISRTYNQQDLSEAFDGKRLHGRTLLIKRESESFLEKVFIYLPAQPTVNTPQSVRPTGANVMKVIAAHELLHACGLENSDHTDDDLFQGNPRVNAGGHAADDKILIGTGPRMLPPLVLGARTIANLRQLWQK